MLNRTRLLHVLSARCVIDAKKIRPLSNFLTPSSCEYDGPPGLRAYNLCRLFDMLGHADYQRGSRSRLMVSRPSLSKLPILGRHLYTVAGARTESSDSIIRDAISSLGIHVSPTETTQPNAEFLTPDRITLDFESPEDAGRLSERLDINCSEVPSAWTLACFSDGIEEFENSLEWHPRNLTFGGVEVYDVGKLHFVDSPAPTEGEFFCRTLANPASPSRYYVVNGPNEARIDEPDFGRFWAISNSNIAPIIFDSRNHLMGVPIATPLPRLLARSACLCSGLAPMIRRSLRRAGGRDYFLFSAVPFPVAQKIAEKLNLTLSPQAL